MTHPPRRTGVPNAVGKPRTPPPPGPPDANALRMGWTLDLLAFLRHGQVATRVDPRGDRSPLPLVMLNGKERVVGLDLLPALRALRSRPRAFSQVAGRFSPLVIGAQDSGKRLLVELWDLDGEPDEDDGNQAQALAKYMQADVTAHGRLEALATLKTARDLPDLLVGRNPLAWLLAGLGT